MRLLVLGPLEIAAGGRRSSLASVRRRTLLGVLVAARGRVVSADRLVDALWGDQAPSGARTTLRSHVSQLRRHLDELEDGAGEAIATRGDGYCLDLDGHELDGAAGARGAVAELVGRRSHRPLASFPRYKMNAHLKLAPQPFAHDRCLTWLPHLVQRL